MPNSLPPLVGVTGGIGSGKSTVCRIFMDFGRTVISADDVARDLTEHDPAVRSAIARAFGKEIYDEKGLRRKALASIVFSDASRRKALDRIVHPRVFTEVRNLAAKFPAGATRAYIIIEAALIFESGMDSMLDATVLVRASEERRLSRIISRNGMSEDEVRLRFQSQNTPEKNSQKAGYIIDNDGPESALLEKVRFIDRLLSLALAGG
jgi:dephospho-CoA kinase